MFYSVPDAPLTPLGKQQTTQLAADSRVDAVRSEIEVVISSPLKRTLQTTKLGWRETVDRLGGLGKVVCLPQLQGASAALLHYGR